MEANGPQRTEWKDRDIRGRKIRDWGSAQHLNNDTTNWSGTDADVTKSTNSISSSSWIQKSEMAKSGSKEMEDHSNDEPAQNMSGIRQCFGQLFDRLFELCRSAF